MSYSGSSEEGIGDDGLQIKPPQHHRHRRGDERQQRRHGHGGEKDRHRLSGGSRSATGDSRRREYYEQRTAERANRNQRSAESASADGRDIRDRRVDQQERHRKRRHEDFGQSEGSSRRNPTGESSGHRDRGQLSDAKQSDQDRASRDPNDLRSKLHKSMKQKRKHLELEEERALREIERRNRREQKAEHESNSAGLEKRRRKRKSSTPGPAPASPQSHQDTSENDAEKQNSTKEPGELEDVLIVDDIIKSSPEMQDEPEPEPKQYEEHPFHSDVSSGDEAEGGSQHEERTSQKSANSESPSSKSGSDSDSSSSDSKSDEEESEEDENNRIADSKNSPQASVAVEVEQAVEVEIVGGKSKSDVDESLLTDVDRAIREVSLLPPYFPAVQGCRRVEEFSLLNRIEEGTYGVVYRAKDRRTNEVVALKRLKMEKEKDGFPITSLREINTLLKAQHENIVTVREIVVGSNTDKIFLVMDYVEHDLKALMETLKQKSQKFLIQEVKCLMIQLLRAVAHLHDNWILHRDLKTSNLLLSHKGILKVGDFGLAREYGSPLKAYTPIVVTLWYRAPELLLGMKEYSTPIDVWSVGCIFGELVRLEPTFPGKSEANELNLIFQTLGTPNDRIWPGYSQLPLLQKMTFVEQPMNKLKSKFGIIGDKGIDLMNKLLTYNPAKRITAEEALNHGFFKETPLPIDPSVFPTWPAKSELGHRKAPSSPKPPSGGRQFKDLRDDDDSSSGFFLGSAAGDRRLPMGGGFSLKF